MRTLTIEAYAKVNLGLRVLGRRPDGYHEIDTVLQNIDLCDRLILEAREDRKIALESGPDLEIPLEENLVYRAAQLVRERVGFPRGVRIRLEKRIPAGAGLGGGSSDAAAVLAGLNVLFGLNLERENLMAWGAELGSDVPFFLMGGRCRARGRGGILNRLADEHPPAHIVLLVPPFALETGEVYAAFDHLGSDASAESPYPNDLEAAALELRPELVAYRTFLGRVSVPFGLSGSGPTYYALFDDTCEARRFARGARAVLETHTLLCRAAPVGHRSL